MLSLGALIKLLDAALTSFLSALVAFSKVHFPPFIVGGLIQEIVSTINYLSGLLNSTGKIFFVSGEVQILLHSP